MSAHTPHEEQELPVLLDDLLAELKRLHPRHTDRRIAAVRQLSHLRLRPDDTENVALRLRQILTGRAREDFLSPAYRAIKGCFIVGAGIGFALALLIFVVRGRGFGGTAQMFTGMTVSLGAISAFFAGPIASIVNAARSRRADDRVRGEAAIALGRLERREALVETASRASQPGDALGEGAALALSELLTILGEPGAAPLTALESLALATALHRLRPETARTVLIWLEHMGSVRALDRIAAFERRCGDPELAAWARRAMASIESRRDHERNRETLLRTAGPAEDLLRPTTGPGCVNEDELLRPAQPLSLHDGSGPATVGGVSFYTGPHAPSEQTHEVA